MSLDSLKISCNRQNDDHDHLLTIYIKCLHIANYVPNVSSLIQNNEENKGGREKKHQDRQSDSLELSTGIVVAGHSGGPKTIESNDRRVLVVFLSYLFVGANQ